MDPCVPDQRPFQQVTLQFSQMFQTKEILKAIQKASSYKECMDSAAFVAGHK